MIIKILSLDVAECFDFPNRIKSAILALVAYLTHLDLVIGARIIVYEIMAANNQGFVLCYV